MVADASKIPLLYAEWVPLLNLLSLSVEGLEQPLYLHDVQNRENAARITRALDLNLPAEVEDLPYGRPTLKLTVPAMISIISATWIRSRQTLFLETDIKDNFGDHRHMTVSGVRDENAALLVLQKLRVPLALAVDDSKSMVETISEMHVSGKSAKEIVAATGFDALTVQCSIRAFKRYVRHQFETAPGRNSDDPTQ